MATLDCVSALILLTGIQFYYTQTPWCQIQSYVRNRCPLIIENGVIFLSDYSNSLHANRQTCNEGDKIFYCQKRIELRQEKTCFLNMRKQLFNAGAARSAA